MLIASGLRRPRHRAAVGLFRRSRALAAVVALAAIIAALSAVAPARADTLKIILPKAPRTLDPHAYPFDPQAYPIIMNSYRRLFDLQDGETVLTTAASLARTARVSDDGLSYTVILREGESFADGTAITPEAVLFSFDRLMSSEAGQRLFPYLKYIRIDGPYTFAFLLNKPWPPFLASLTLPQASLISPLLAGYPADHLRENTLGSGRYVVVKVEEGKITLRRREDISASNSPTDVEIYYEPDPRRRLDAYKAQGAHLAELEPPLLESVPEGSEIRSFPTWDTHYLAFNFDNQYLQSQPVRDALALSAENAFTAEPTRPQGLLPRGFHGAAAPAPPRELSLVAVTAEERARALLLEPGPPPTPLVMAYPGDDPRLRADAETLAAKFHALGVPTNLAPLNGAAGQGIMEKGDYAFYLGKRIPEIPSSEMWLGRFLDSRARTESNPAHFKDPVVDSQIDAFDAALPRPEREARVKAVATLAGRARPYVLLYQENALFVADKRLGDLTPHPMWPLYWPFDKINLNPFRRGARDASPPADPAPSAPEPTLDFAETVAEFFE
ncbi:MAG: ABC transporter substrate-binding protein [Deltaproteobacteria bacterium]|jgi:peptide/nickel transport system substrate-binding protein|nr:ABC transporter substrate-binding protein [Deltaproteobacteria bacterium]